MCGVAGVPGGRAVRVQLLAARLAISAARGAGVCGRGLRREPRADSATKSVTAMTTDELPWKLWGAVTGYGETKSVTALTTDDLPWKLWGAVTGTLSRLRL